MLAATRVNGHSCHKAMHQYGIDDASDGALDDSGLPVAVRRSARCELRDCAWSLVQYCADRAWFGITPLDRHIVICGFPRAGSTVLHLMLATSIPHVLAFDRERNAVQVARYILHNRSCLVTKRPNDIFRVDEICDIYRHRRGDVRFLLTLRDPRDVLVSHHAQDSSEYYVTANRWLSIYETFTKVSRLPEALVIRFEELITNTESAEIAIRRIVGCYGSRRFQDFHQANLAGFDKVPLNGLRPLDPAAVGRWREAKHAARLRHVLSELPMLPDYLINLGYEDNSEWVKEYGSRTGMS